MSDIKRDEADKFWDRISPLYDLFVNVYNHKTYAGTGKKVAEFIDSTDDVLECACGTGAITIYIASRCKSLIATDFAAGMLKQATKKCRKYDNVRFKCADITNIKCRDARFDKVVAGNVIHLLPDPGKALAELERVVKLGGKIIIPTFINKSKKSAGLVVKFNEFLGVDFKKQFDMESYRSFFEEMGYDNVEYHVVEGRMPCAIAVIKKR
ncbi:MAG: class I SAM-dependent methyltransferase [Lachnospiraceae bacterium]|nr:class I SAM-dependent methyltransferase [Lachnospiraceae bacterium]